jgi:hypothetical protein
MLMSRSTLPLLWLTLFLVFALASFACNDGGNDNEIVLNDNGGRDYRPVIEPANFVRTIDNPRLTLIPGNVWVYEGTNEDGKPSRTELEVTADTKVILGVTTTVIRDRAYEGEKLVEDTLDWYAQDRDGNVWYFGEDSKEIKDGKVVSTEGSWEAGVKDARAGIIMLGQPKVGNTYRQEYLKGEAEGIAEVLSLDKSVKIGLGSYQDCVQIKEWAPNEKHIVEHKYYCSELGGLALIEKVVGESGRMELVRVRTAN